MKWAIGTERPSGRNPEVRRRGGLRRSWRPSIWLVAWGASLCFCAWSDRAAADEVLRAPVEPEVIDVVYRRLVEQRRTLEAVVEIVERLESVAGQAGAARELLSDVGEPTERLKRALQAVAGRRSSEQDALAGFEEQDTMPSAPAARVPQAIRVKVVYAQKTDDGGRVVIAAQGAHYAAPVGRRIRIGDDVVEILGVDTAGDALAVRLRVNGGAVVLKRVQG